MDNSILAPFPPGFVLRALEEQRRQQEVEDGIRAIVRTYYQNYTDATTLEPTFTRALMDVAQHIDLYEDDLFEIVVGEERAINAAGGIESGTTGDRHNVGPTFEIEEDDE